MDNMQTIHNRLFYCLRELNKMRSLFSVCPDKDFSRNRSLDFVKTITTILGFQGKTLDKELIDIGKPVTASALVQRRGKILTEAFYYLFRSYAESIPVRKKYDGYRLIAADGSDVNTPHNKDSAFYHQGEIVRGVQVKGFNQLHLNALYDVLNKTYIDASMPLFEYLIRVPNTNTFKEVSELPMEELDRDIGRKDERNLKPKSAIYFMYRVA